MKDSARYLNRELSWLSFNARVLEEAAREELPLLERAKFLAIVSSNLDEFFMVRVGKLERKADAGENTPDPAGMMPRQQLRAIRKASGQQVKRQPDDVVAQAGIEGVVPPQLAAIWRCRSSASGPARPSHGTRPRPTGRWE